MSDEMWVKRLNRCLDHKSGYKNREKYVILKNGIEWQVWRNLAGSEEQFMEEFWKESQDDSSSNPPGYKVSSSFTPMDAFNIAFNIILDEKLDAIEEDVRALDGALSNLGKVERVGENYWEIDLNAGLVTERGSSPAKVAAKILKRVLKNNLNNRGEATLDTDDKETAEQINRILEDKRGFDFEEKYIVLYNETESEWQVWQNLTESKEQFFKEFNGESCGENEIKFYGSSFGRKVSFAPTPVEALAKASKRFLEWDHSSMEVEADEVDSALGGLGDIEKIGENCWQIDALNGLIKERGPSPGIAAAQVLHRLLAIKDKNEF